VLSLCLSRACLGQIIVFIYTWLKRTGLLPGLALVLALQLHLHDLCVLAHTELGVPGRRPREIAGAVLDREVELQANYNVRSSPAGVFLSV
jgi:hypothetical protein